jgi:hypothetical protein
MQVCGYTKCYRPLNKIFQQQSLTSMLRFIVHQWSVRLLLSRACSRAFQHWFWICIVTKAQQLAAESCRATDMCAVLGRWCKGTAVQQQNEAHNTLAVVLGVLPSVPPLRTLVILYCGGGAWWLARMAVCSCTSSMAHCWKATSGQDGVIPLPQGSSLVLAEGECLREPNTSGDPWGKGMGQGGDLYPWCIRDGAGT